jgi:hypothetical protein
LSTGFPRQCRRLIALARGGDSAAVAVLYARYAAPASDAFPALTRGGNWNEGFSAGIFALNATNAPSSASIFVGFRCAR